MLDFAPLQRHLQVVNLVSNRLVKIVGKVENTERFLRIALYQACFNTDCLCFELYWSSCSVHL
jgi:hypothetical protein